MTALALKTPETVGTDAAGRSKRRPNDWLVLTKFRISIMSTLTAAMGYIAARQAVDTGLLSTALGTLLLAMAASTLNEVQERDIDALMPRTQDRPLPSGRISVRQAGLLALALATSGYIILHHFHGVVPSSLGLLALIWYNGIYTPLKRITAFAVVPGSLIGSIPPAIGWTATGAGLWEPALLALSFVFFVWQVPHFWLLALRHSAGYERGGLPTLSRHFSSAQIYRLIFTWTAACVASCSLLVAFQAVSSVWAIVALATGGIWLLARFSFMLQADRGERGAVQAFMDINGFALLVIVAVIFDSLI
jgi:heme o synthase